MVAAATPPHLIESAAAQPDVSPTRAMPAIELTDYEVTRAFDRVAGLDSKGASRLQHRTVDAQPELTAFTLALTEGLTEDERSFAVFLFHCICAAITKHSKTVRRVSEKAVTRQWPLSVQRIRDLALTPDADAADEVYIAHGPQPALLVAVLEALGDPEEGEDPVAISDEAYWQLLTVCDTLVVTLHEAATPEGAG